MEKIKILIFDEEEITSTLVESYIKELTFQCICEKYTQFNDALLAPTEEKRIIIFSINKQNMEILKKVSKLASDIRNNFIAISYDNSTDLNVCALRTGVKDFLLKPLKKSDFIYSLQKIYKNNIVNEKDTRLGTIYSASSIERGMGKSLFLINVAKEVADLSGEKVLLIDFNNSLSDISFLLNVEIRNNTNQYINNLTDENANKMLERLHRYGNSELYVMANGFHRDATEKINFNRFHEVMYILRKHYRYIFIDKNILDVNIDEYVRQNSDTVFYLITPIPRIAEDVKNRLNLIYNKKDVKLICNKYENRNEQKLELMKSVIGKDIFATIPKNFMATGASVNNRVTLKEIGADLDIVKAYKKIADYIISRN